MATNRSRRLRKKLCVDEFQELGFELNFHYKEGVDAFRVTDRLSDSDREILMGGSLQKIYGWSPAKK